MMKRIPRCLITYVFSALMLLTCIIPVSAAQPNSDNISPMYAIPISVDVIGNITTGPTVHVVCEYAAALDSGVTRVDITTYVEKRNLLVLWDRVDIGMPNNEWSTICYGIENYASYSALLPSSGTYRITSVFEVYCGRDLVETIEVTTNNYSC